MLLVIIRPSPILEKLVWDSLSGPLPRAQVLKHVFVILQELHSRKFRQSIDEVTEFVSRQIILGNQRVLVQYLAKDEHKRLVQEGPGELSHFFAVTESENEKEHVG